LEEEEVNGRRAVSGTAKMRSRLAI